MPRQLSAYQLIRKDIKPYQFANWLQLSRRRGVHSQSNEDAVRRTMPPFAIEL